MRANPKAERKAAFPADVVLLLNALAAQALGLAASPQGLELQGMDVVLDVTVGEQRILVLRAGHPQEDVKLSPREREIARMVAKGYPNKTIAAVLDISTWTVGTHLRRMFAKLGVHSRAAMIGALRAESLQERQSTPLPAAKRAAWPAEPQR
jgi:DNA-binding CsgD family transcriptional regulator